VTSSPKIPHEAPHDAAPHRHSLSLGVITVSDTRTPETDESGKLIGDLCRAAGHSIASMCIVPDEPEQVRGALAAALGRADVEAVLVNGGTGVSARDRTFEAITSSLDRRIDGFGELFRSLSYQEIGARAMLSRAVAGVRSGKPVFSMPGSPAAVRLAMEKLILPALGHVVAEAKRTT
jgi:molybdenum cofactor biosynthesis protein B